MGAHRRRESQSVVGLSLGKTLPQLKAPLFSFLAQAGGLLLGGNVDHKAHHFAAVTKYIIILENEFDKVITEGNAIPSNKDGRRSVTVKVTKEKNQSSVARLSFRGPPVPVSPPYRCHHILQLSLDSMSDLQLTS